MSVPISNVTRRVVLTASGTGPYSFTFEILAASDIAVYRDDTLLTITTDYTVTINTNGTGYVTLTATPTGASTITIVGNRTIQRTSDFVTGGDLFANTLNQELDSLTIFSQQNAESIDRSLKIPVTDPVGTSTTIPDATERASKYLAFNSSGDLIVTAGTTSTNPVSSTMSPFVSSETLSAARTELGLGTMATQNASAVAITGGTIAGVTATTTTLTSPTITSPTISGATITGGSITGMTDIVVADGGTGRSNLTAESVLIGDGTNAVKFVAPGTNGNVLTSNGTAWTSAALSIPSQLIRGTAKATTTGTSVEFTSLPATVKRITLIFDQISTDSTSPMIVQLGDSGGYEATAYVSASTDDAGTTTETTGFVLRNTNAAGDFLTGSLVLNNISGNKWVSSHTAIGSNNNRGITGAGVKTLSDVLDRVRITTVTGTSNFDSGSFNIMYE